MIGEFLASWPLFHNSYLSGWAIGVVLAMVGVPVVARDQIFIGAAVSQASMLGIAVAMRLGGAGPLGAHAWASGDAMLAACGGVFAVLGALATTRATHGTGGESREAVTGWVFLLGASGSVLLLSGSPHGLEEVHRLMWSTIIGATSTETVLFGVLATVTVLAVARWWAPLLLLIVDADMARAVGLRVARWDGLLSIWLGVAIGLAIHAAGLIFSFGCLVLPALVAKNVCREVRTMFLVAPLVSVGCNAAAFVLANHYDSPPGQFAVAVLCAVLAGAWGGRVLRLARAK